MNQVLNFAHRGASGYAPENTLQSFELALKMGTNALESDVQLTRDNHLVFFHDNHIGKGWGYRPIGMVSLKHLQQKDLGAGARVPTVEEVFSHFQGQKITWSIDTPGKREGAELVRLAQKYGFLEHLFMVNTGFRIKEAWEQAGLPKNQFVWSIRDYQIRGLGPSNIVRTSQKHAIHILNFKLDWLTPEIHQAVTAAGIRIFIWDVHNGESIKVALTFHPDAIYSNYPDIARKLINEHLPITK